MTDAMSLEQQFCAYNYEPLPVALVRGEGAYVWDQSGRRYMDLLGAYSAVSFGHCHPRLVKVLTEQAGTLDTISRAFYSERLGPFLQRACELTGYDMALPMNTGAEAVETALKAARKWAYKVKGVAPGQAEIIACNGNFHGRTIAITGMSTAAPYRDGFDPFPAGFKHVPFGDATALEAAITGNTAAFLVEPIQGEGGIVVPPDGYLAACARICRQHDVLLICDEIQTGLGRTGALLAADHEGVKPDGVTLGKALGGGLYPVSLFLARREVMEVFTPGDHGSTFGGNPIAAAIGLAVFDILVEEDICRHAADLGGYLRQRLDSLASPLITEIRGKGLLLGLAMRQEVPARKLCEALMRHDILCNNTNQNVVRVAPPLNITRDQIDWAVERIGKALAEVAQTELAAIAVPS